MIALTPSGSPTRACFRVPGGAEATMPPERRGVARDGVRLLVATQDGVSHHRFSDLPALLAPGDLVVVNTSATLPAALRAHHADGRPALVHVSTWLDAATWVVEVRGEHNDGPDLSMHAGATLRLPGGVILTMAHPHPDREADRSRLWAATLSPPTELVPYLSRFGRPIRYRHLAAEFPLSDHQTVYAGPPGSAEMPSAGRPFTADLLARLIGAGITVAPLTLHAGVSSAELHEPPGPERYDVPDATMHMVAATRAAGGRVVAVGTTVVRALETVARDPGGHGGRGWTDLVLGPHHRARVVTGMITGLHLPESSHLMLLEAVVGARLVRAAYAAALEGGYLWHEFGDSMLLLP